MDTKTKNYILFLIIIAVTVGWWHVFKPAQETPIAIAIYTCKDGKIIQAEFYKGKSIPVQPGQPPIPSGKIILKLSDKRELTIPQTISASGIRYANTDESFIFWNKGNSAFIIENNMKTFSDCISEL